MNRRILFALLTVLLTCSLRSAHALTVTAGNLNTYSIPYETVGTPTGTTVQFTLDTVADVEVDILHMPDLTPVASLTQTGMSSGANTIFWNGLWYLGGDNGRQDGSY